MVNADLITQVNNIYADGGSTTINIPQVHYFEYDQYDFNDERDFGRFIDDLKRTVRMSFEYRSLINYLRHTTGMDECSVLENVTCRDTTKVRIEIHHAPLTLEDICLAIVKKRMNNGESLNLNACAQEVMFCHYNRWVGLIPLSATVHELVHNSYFFIPVDKVFGNYKQFLNLYYSYIDPVTIDAIEAAEKATREYNNDQMQIFNNHTIYVNPEGYNNENFINMKPAINDKIEQIKAGYVAIPKSTNNKKTMCYIVNNKKPKISL